MDKSLLCNVSHLEMSPINGSIDGKLMKTFINLRNSNLYEDNVE